MAAFSAWSAAAVRPVADPVTVVPVTAAPVTAGPVVAGPVLAGPLALVIRSPRASAVAGRGSLRRPRCWPAAGPGPGEPGPAGPPATWPRRSRLIRVRRAWRLVSP